MKTNRNNSQRSAFTLIEMVGVLAVIAILAALLVPKIFAAINDSRINGTVSAVNVAKTATMNYFGKKGNFGTNATTAFATVLLTNAVLDDVFTTKLGTAATIETKAGAAADTVVDGSNEAWNLDDSAATGANDAVGSFVVFVKIAGVAAKDAVEISQRIDGDSLSNLTVGGADLKGRVKYAAGTTTTDVYVYLAAK
jgi:type IV pilus assembly protein PilA